LGREALSESGLLEPAGSRRPLRRVRTARLVCERASSLLSQDASNVDMNEFPRFDFERSIVMSNQNENLGGRLPLLDPKELAPAQAKLYKVMDNTLIAWANQTGFVVKTRDGKFIGPFNPFPLQPWYHGWLFPIHGCGTEEHETGQAHA